MSHDILKSLKDYIQFAADHNYGVDKIDIDLTNYGLSLHKMKEVVFFDYGWDVDNKDVTVEWKVSIDPQLNRLYSCILSFTHLGTGPSTTLDANEAYERAMKGI